ncbi:MAG: DnaJ domain-containing protein [Synergistaceae bacterium]|nr:DnaJ domain-containing protein [Synergistaceae bacterium]MBR0184451.1 DnaJ domain-containing protein [Synergistaceae bacterium]
MNNSEIISSLHELGLEVGATTDDIHAAFRKLARELHPDVTGQKSNFRFQQVTGAYTVLKNLTPEELESLVKTLPEHEKNRLQKIEQKRREESQKAERSAKIDSILSKYESDFRDYYSAKKSGDDSDMKAIIFRMKSQKHKVINTALKHSAPFANRVEFRKALTEILRRPEIDSSTAEIAASLPFDDRTRKLIALDTSSNAKNFPAGLIISLIGNDADAMESMLLHVSPENTAVILRRWPSGRKMNNSVIRSLLASDDVRILVPILGAIRTHFPASAIHHKKRIAELENHSAAAVRAWAKKLL